MHRPSYRRLKDIIPVYLSPSPRSFPRNYQGQYTRSHHGQPTNAISHSQEPKVNGLSLLYRTMPLPVGSD